MLTCGHKRAPFGAAICAHLRACREGPIDYFRWYTGVGLDVELLCGPCADAREQGLPAATELVCEVCFQYATAEVGDLAGIRGKPGSLTRAEPFSVTLRKTALPKEVGTIIDVAPIDQEGQSIWLMLAEDGLLIRFDADTGEWARLASASVATEPDHEPFAGHALRRRLHASTEGTFAAVVNDYGRYGQIIDLRTGRVTLALDGGDYHPETVPFSFAFTQVQERVVAVHRTDWNRLDVSDPATGALLSDRGPTSYREGEAKPDHYLDYFHGALHLSPSGAQVVDDGWVWHPLGAPTTWSVERWVSDNIWESEDGPTKKDFCVRNYYWDHAITWLDETRVAIGGLGDDDRAMIDGARIFDITLSGNRDGRWGAEWRSARELIAFPGPAGAFFSDGTWLFFADQHGLSRWDLNDGARTGFLPGFQPTRHHRSAGELVQIADDTLLRWKVRD
jgi:hypothetical protein